VENKISYLKLYGKNLEDLRTISAYLQDSIVKINELVFLKKNQIFLMMVKRFMWEDIEKGLFRNPKRINSVIKFNNVLRVISKNINQLNKNRILELLTIEAKSLSDLNCEISLIFSGASTITITTEDIDIILDDQGIPWEAKSFPKHKI